jgi:hypothetical protein
VILAIALILAALVGLGYALLIRTLSRNPMSWLWFALPAYLYGGLILLLQDIGFVVAGVVALLAIAAMLPKMRNRWVALAGLAGLVAVVAFFQLTRFPVPNIFTAFPG